MNIIELINRVGMDNIKVQPLKGSITNCRLLKGERDTSITFVTGADVMTPIDSVSSKSKKTGLVLWFDMPDLDSPERAPLIPPLK